MLGRPIMALLTLSWSECVRIVEETASMVIIACCFICFTLTINCVAFVQNLFYNSTSFIKTVNNFALCAKMSQNKY